MMTKLMQRYFSALEADEVEIVDQLHSDVETAKAEGYLDTEQYAIDVEDTGAITILDKVNDEIAHIAVENGNLKIIDSETPEDNDSEVKLESEDSSDTQEGIEEFPIENVESEEKEFAKATKDDLIFRIKGFDIGYNPKLRIAYLVDDERYYWKVSPNTSLEKFIKDTEKRLEDPNLATPIDKSFSLEDRLSKFSDTTKSYLKRVKLESNLKKFSSTTQEYIRNLKAVEHCN